MSCTNLYADCGRLRGAIGCWCGWKAEATVTAMFPRPSVHVNSRPSEDGNGHRIDISIVRENSKRSYGATAEYEAAATGKVIEQILADPFTIEWLPEKMKSY